MTHHSTLAPLTWSFRSVRVHDEHNWDEQRERHGPTGRGAAIDAALATGRDYAAALNMSGSAGTPSLDPVPQEVRAIVEARLTAEVSPAVVEAGATP